MKRQATNLEKIFAEDTSDKGSIPQLYKEFLKLNKNNPVLKNGPKALTDTSPRRYTDGK